jgi:hypothetical protein
VGFQDWPGNTAMTSSANLGRAAPRALSGEAELSDLLGGVPFEEAADGKESSMFQFLRGALVSHATQCTRSRLRRTLLF